MKRQNLFSAARIMGAAALTMGIVLAASVALTSCKKDDASPEPVTPATLKHLNDLVGDGYYGAVKSITTLGYTNVKPNSDTSGVDYSAARAISTTTTEYSADGYRTGSTTKSAQDVYNQQTGVWEYPANAEQKLSSKTIITRDEKNRITKEEYNYYNNDTVWRANSTVTVYTYDMAAKKVTLITKTLLGVDRNKYVYGLDDDGYMDQNALTERYRVSTTAFEQKPYNTNKTTILSKDPQGNKTAQTYFYVYRSTYTDCTAYDEIGQCTEWTPVTNVNFSVQYNTYSYEYY